MSVSLASCKVYTRTKLARRVWSKVEQSAWGRHASTCIRCYKFIALRNWIQVLACNVRDPGVKFQWDLSVTWIMLNYRSNQRNNATLTRMGSGFVWRVSVLPPVALYFSHSPCPPTSTSRDHDINSGIVHAELQMEPKWKAPLDCFVFTNVKLFNFKLLDTEYNLSRLGIFKIYSH